MRLLHDREDVMLCRFLVEVFHPVVLHTCPLVSVSSYPFTSVVADCLAAAVVDDDASEECDGVGRVARLVFFYSLFA